MLAFDHTALHFSFEQVCLALGPDFLLTFQDNPDVDILESLRARLRSGRGLPLQMDAAHICHAALDAVADSYLAAADLIDDTVIELGNAVSGAFSPGTVQRIYHLQRELLRLRKWVLPFRDMIAQLMHRRSAHFPEGMSVYLSDVHDHVCQTLDALDLNLELLSAQLSLAVSLENNRMSEVMKVLTIFTALFMPVTFIAGVYGMNFAHMPEITQPWGYPAVLCLMAAAILLMLRFFRKRRWL
jgi:magnesium transporter